MLTPRSWRSSNPRARLLATSYDDRPKVAPPAADPTSIIGIVLGRRGPRSVPNSLPKVAVITPPSQPGARAEPARAQRGPIQSRVRFVRAWRDTPTSRAIRTHVELALHRRSGHFARAPAVARPPRSRDGWTGHRDPGCPDPGPAWMFTGPSRQAWN